MGRPLATRAARNADAPGIGTHWNMVSDGKRNQAKAGIGDAGHTGVRDQRDSRSAFQVEHQLRRASQFIVFVIARRSEW